jgi:hypothetical protein
MADIHPHKSDDKGSVNLPIDDTDLENIRDGASEAYYDHGDTNAYWDLRFIAQIDELRKAILQTIARADDYGDSYITRPIRDAMKKT